MQTVPAIATEHLNASRDFQVSQQWHKFALRLFPLPFGNQRLLDVGTGGGGVAAVAAEGGWKVTGIDIGPSNIDCLHQRGLDGEVVDLNGDFPFADASFSCATFIEVAEHLVRAEHAFAEISRVLVPGGKLLFTTPNNASYRRRIKALKGRAPDDEGYHFRFWVRRQLEQKLAAAGLMIEDANSYGYLPLIDTLTLHKIRTGKRSVFPISKRFEPLLADRFVWLLRKT
jgi:SAM-dependent methyltransferase